MEKQASVWKMIKSDHWTFQFFVYWVIFFGGFGYSFLTNSGGEIKSYSALVVIILLMVLPFFGFILRVRRIKSIFEDGNRNTAVVNKVHFYRWKGTVTYMFDYHGEQIQVKNFVIKNGTTRELTPGQTVVIYHSTENPKSAVIESLFR